MKETNFKQTEIGMIPHDWDVRKVGDLMSIGSGETITANSFIINGKYPVFGGNGIRGYYDDFNLNGEYILIGRVGALCGNIHITQGKSFASEHALVCRPQIPYDNIFVAEHLRMMNLGQYSGASAQPVLAARKLQELPIVYAPANEQSNVGSTIKSVNRLIKSLYELIEKKRAIKTGAMSQLLSGKLRLPGFTKPWITSTLDEIGYLLSNNTLSRDNLTESGTIGNIHYGDILIKFGAVLDLDKATIPFIIPELSEKFLKAHWAKDGDIIFADTAEDCTVGKATELINVKNRRIVSGLHTFWFRPNKKFASHFLGYAVNSKEFHQQVIPVISGTKVCSISKPNLLNFTLSYPSDIEEQKAIAKVLTDMDDEIFALEEKLKKYEQLKKGMMQQLLTGKIRLVSPNEALS